MNPIELWPWAVLLGLAAFAFFLGPLLAGLLLIILIVVVIANILSPF